MIRNLCIAVENWMDDESFILMFLKFSTVLIAPILIIAFVLSKFSSDSPENDCLAHGGGWAVSGYHTAPLVVGKVITTQRVTEYACFEVKR